MNNTEYWTADKFYERLEFYLEKKGWSYNRLSNESDIGVSMLYEMRRKHYLPRMKNLCSICDALGISLTEFFDVDETYDTENLSMELSNLSLPELHTIRLLINVLKKHS